MVFPLLRGAWLHGCACFSDVVFGVVVRSPVLCECSRPLPPGVCVLFLLMCVHVCTCVCVCVGGGVCSGFQARACVLSPRSRRQVVIAIRGCWATDSPANRKMLMHGTCMLCSPCAHASEFVVAPVWEARQGGRQGGGREAGRVGGRAWKWKWTGGWREGPSRTLTLHDLHQPDTVSGCEP